MRLEGWEARLQAVIEDARARPYKLGEHDCLEFACATVAALTGVDHWPEFKGRYTTRREAMKFMAQRGATFDDVFSQRLGAPVAVHLARRGDVVKFVDDEAHLGVCVGAQAAVLAEAGLRFVPLEQCAHAWRVA